MSKINSDIGTPFVCTIKKLTKQFAWTNTNCQIRLFKTDLPEDD